MFAGPGPPLGGTASLPGVRRRRPLGGGLDDAERLGLDPDEAKEPEPEREQRVWSGSRSPDDPEVSPLHLPLDGLPPVDVYVGDRDILRPAVDEPARRAEAAGVCLTVHEATAMFHVWMTQRIPEGRATRRELVELVRSAGD